jgi:hypothetical protein
MYTTRCILPCQCCRQLGRKGLTHPPSFSFLIRVLQMLDEEQLEILLEKLTQPAYGHLLEVRPAALLSLLPMHAASSMLLTCISFL